MCTKASRCFLIYIRSTLEFAFKRHKLMLFCINSVLLLIGIQKLINTVYILSSYIFFLAVLIFLHIFCFHLMLLHQFAIILYPFY